MSIGHYQTQAKRDWTRIDMLLALYDAAIGSLQAALDAQQQKLEGQVVHHRFRASTLVLALRSGLDFDHGDLPRKIEQLLLYVDQCISDGSPDRLHSAIRVLQTLSEGYGEIRPDAIQLERNGVIPPFLQEASINCIA